MSETEHRCPRCWSVVVREPSGEWACYRHGWVEPVAPQVAATPANLAAVAQRSRVPVWVLWPPPPDWLLTGVNVAGDAGRGHAAVAVASSGPALEGSADIVVVAEEPGTGLGAHLAGCHGFDVGARLAGQPYLRASVGGHETPMWLVEGADTVVALVGERDACWLWLLVQPLSAAPLLLDAPPLADVRDLGAESRLLGQGGWSQWLDQGHA